MKFRRYLKSYVFGDYLLPFISINIMLLFITISLLSIYIFYGQSTYLLPWVINCFILIFGFNGLFLNLYFTKYKKIDVESYKKIGSPFIETTSITSIINRVIIYDHVSVIGQIEKILHCIGYTEIVIEELDVYSEFITVRLYYQDFPDVLENIVKFNETVGITGVVNYDNKTINGIYIKADDIQKINKSNKTIIK